MYRITSHSSYDRGNGHCLPSDSLANSDIIHQDGSSSDDITWARLMGLWLGLWLMGLWLMGLWLVLARLGEAVVLWSAGPQCCWALQVLLAFMEWHDTERRQTWTTERMTCHSWFVWRNELEGRNHESVNSKHCLRKEGERAKQSSLLMRQSGTKPPKLKQKFLRYNTDELVLISTLRYIY